MSATEEFEVIGMHCTSCARLVEMAVGELEGVVSVKVDYPSGRASVEYDPGSVAAAELNKAVEEAGYRIGGDSGDKDSAATAGREPRREDWSTT